jgi:AhpD family alkylhydroperoxidase
VGFAHYRQLHEPTDNLDAAQREMIAVAVSMANGCLYCLVAHGAALREALGDPILADRITLDHRRAGLDERRTAILDFAVKVTERPLDCDHEDLQRFQGFGLTEEEVWDVVEMSCSVYKPRARIARPAYGTRHTASRARECLEKSGISVSLLDCCAAWLALPRPAFRRNTTDACDPGHQIVDKSTDKPGLLSLTDSKVGSV